MRTLITYFIKHPVAGNVIMLLIMLFGFFGLQGLKKTFFPTVESKVVNVTAAYPGASPEEIEEGIVLKIEQRLKGLTGVERVMSTSKENIGTLRVEVLKGFDTDLILQDVKNAIDQINSFPDGMEPVLVVKQEAVGFAINFALSGNVDLKTLKKYAQKAEDDLLAINGISKVTVSGYPDEEIEITFRENDLQAYKLTFEQATNAIRRANLEITGGKVKTNNEELLVRPRSKKYYAHELRDIIIKATEDGKIVRLNDVAEVADIWSDNPNRTYMNGNPSVTITIMNTNDEDIIFIADEVQKYVDNFNVENDVLKATVVRDSSTTIRQRIALLTKNGLIGFVLVFLFLTLFLNYRLAFWVAISIPVSFAGMFILASYVGLTLNVMSLFGMILVIGILVDDGIVIGENIFQHWEKGKTPLKAAMDGTMQVIPAVISAVMTTVIAFATFFFLDGRLGDFAPDLAFVVISTLLFSLVEGALVLPAHIGFSKALERKEKAGFDKFMEKIESSMNKIMMYARDRMYAPLLKLTIENKTASIAFFIALFMLTVGGLKGGLIKLTFFPAIGGDSVTISLELPPGTRDHVTEAILVRIEKSIEEVNEELTSEREDGKSVIEKYERAIGPATNVGTINISLLDGEARNMESYLIANAIRDKVGPVPEAEKLSFGAVSMFGKPVSVSLLGNNLDELNAAKQELKEELSKIAALRDVNDNDQKGIREINIELKEKAYLLGLNLQQILAQVRQGFFGSEVQRLQRGEDEVKIWIRYHLEDRNSLGKLENMRIRLDNGSEIPLKEVATYHIERGIIAINHLDGKREVKVEADMKNPNESSTEINSNIEAEILPPILAKFPSVSASFEGQSKQSEKTATSGKKTLPIIFILMMAMVTLTFRSFPQTIAIFIIIPLGIIGVGWGHYLHGHAISLLSGFGVIALIGIMVNDSLVLVGAMNEFLKEGMSFSESVYEAGRSRFRPIMLTSFTTIAGLGPLIMETSRQAQFLIPMAIAVAYGLGIATFTTLFLLPSLLIIVNDFRRGGVFITRTIFDRNLNAEVPTAEEVEPAVIEQKIHQKLKEEMQENEE